MFTSASPALQTILPCTLARALEFNSSRAYTRRGALHPIYTPYAPVAPCASHMPAVERDLLLGLREKERGRERGREGGRGRERVCVCMSEYEREWQRRHLQPWRLSLPGRRRARRGAPRTGACHQSGQASVPLPLGTCHARRSGAHQELARRGRSTRTRAKRAHSLESFPCTGARFNKRHSRVRACVYVRFVCVVWACGHLGVWAGQKARRRASLTTAAAVRPGRISPRPGLRDRTDILSPGPPAR